MVGPETIGDEFDETEEDEKADPQTVYALLEDNEVEHTLTITSPSDERLVLLVDGDDAIVTISGSSGNTRMVVPRSALAEACRTVGIVRE